MEDNSVSHLGFGDYDINIDLDSLNKTGGKMSKELDERNIGDLIQFIRAGISNKIHLSEALMELHERFAIPFACLSLGLLAFPLGVQSASLRKSSGFSLGIFFFLFYYFLLAAGWSAGETGDYPPILGMWLPNVIMGGVGIFFLIKNAKEEPVILPAFLTTAILIVKNRFAKKR
jgi:lipopolysaccharide export system permease protein